MSIVEAFRNRVRDCLDLLGIQAENRQAQPGIDRVESAVVISRIFEANATAQQFQNDLAMRGIGPRVRIDNNAAELGRDH
jgi:hypothetical protein